MGQEFPFWVRQQTPLFLRVCSAEPASLVRLTRGLELAIAPRPRQRVQRAVLSASLAADDESPQPSEVSWLRIQASFMLWE